MKKSKSYWFTLKKICILCGVILLTCVVVSPKDGTETEPSGEQIDIEDVVILLQVLGLQEGQIKECGIDTEIQDDAKLYYRQYLRIMDCIYENMIVAEPTSMEQKLSHTYQPGQCMLKEDWYKAYFCWVRDLGKEERIYQETLIPLMRKDQDFVIESGGECQSVACLTDELNHMIMQKTIVCRNNERILTVISTEENEPVHISRALVLEADERTELFYKGFHLQVEIPEQIQNREEFKDTQIADFVFQNGKCSDLKMYSKKIHGRLLRRNDDEIEIEDLGRFVTDQDMPIYMMSGENRMLTRSDLRIGYDNVDYIVEHNRVIAALAVQYEITETIRVLLTNNSTHPYIWNQVSVVVDGKKEELSTKQMKPGQRISFTSANVTEGVEIVSMETMREDNMYRGTVECLCADDGIVMINELPLEEYLYAVVPSEMPASYPAEALKAQAICARTYACHYIENAGIPEYGAHLDDTTAYQVYHNCREYYASTEAVKQTEGTILMNSGHPEQNIYYYSTSCGVGADVAIWNGTSVYRQTEDAFVSFIKTVHEENPEQEEPWYRWRYEVEKVDVEQIIRRLRERYLAAPHTILTKAENGTYEKQMPEEYRKKTVIKKISILERGSGGVAQKLQIVTNKAEYMILTEYSIRCLLCDEEVPVVRQDGSSVSIKTLLPSGFFVIETGMKNGNVVGYTLYGGGYGHGVGMSQNGAKALANKGKNYEQILQFYFYETELGEI